MFSDIHRILINLAIQLPVLIAMLVGIIIAIVTWKRNPKPSLFTLLSILIYFVFIILASLSNELYYFLQVNLDLEYSLVDTIMIITQVVLSVIIGSAWGLLLAAIFSGRKAETEQKS